MARRLNFTGRRKINQGDVTFRIVREGDGLNFDAELRLGEYGFPETSLVHVEAYRGASTLWKRFDFGRAGLVTPASDRSLDEFEEAAGILFRVKVSAEGDGRGKLLGEADKIRPRLPDDEELPGTPLIKPTRAKIGAEPWRVQFDDDMPVLAINERITGWKLLVQEPGFRALVAPAAMRQILTQALIIDGDAGDDEDDGDWRTRWRRFAESLPNVGECPGVVDDETDVREVEEWIDTAVSSFAARSGLLSALLQLDEETGA